MTEARRKQLSVLAFVIFLVFCLLVTVFIGGPMVRLARHPEQFRQWVDSFGLWGRLIFIGIVVLQVIVAMIPGEAIELAAGYAFGAWEGTLLSLAGIVIGSYIVFFLVRKFGIRMIGVFFADREIRRLNFLRDVRKAKVLTFLLMTIPGTPKDLLSYFAGLLPLSARQWLSIVAVARIPSVVMSTVSGDAAGEKNYLFAAAVMAVTMVISLTGILYYRKICKENPENPAES